MIYVLLPAYNESVALPLLLDQIRQVEWPNDEPYTVLVVDDGSTDATVPCCRARWEQMPIEIICHGFNRGLGAAMTTGLEHCVSCSGTGDTIVTLDADNTHSPSHIPHMLRNLRKGADIVIASRYVRGGAEIGLTPFRKIMSRGASTMLHVMFPIEGVRDYTCGFRAYTSEILQRGFREYSGRLIEESGFVCMAELLLKLGSIGAKVVEVPLVLRYDRKEGASKMKVARTVSRYLALVTINRARLRPNPSPENEPVNRVR